MSSAGLDRRQIIGLLNELERRLSDHGISMDLQVVGGACLCHGVGREDHARIGPCVVSDREGRRAAQTLCPKVAHPGTEPHVARVAADAENLCFGR